MLHTSSKVDNTAHLISAARRVVNEYLVTQLEAHGLVGFAPSHGDIIVTLLRHESITMTELANRINRDRSTVTTLVQKLKDKGYVAFRDNPVDARSRLVYLTDLGQQLMGLFAGISEGMAATMWQDIGDAERAAFRETLRKIINNFNTISGE